MKLNFLIILTTLFISINISAQSYIAITIDDVPNIKGYGGGRTNSYLLDKLDSLKIPTAIFINEQLIYKNNDEIKNKKLLQKWISNKNITSGNHTYKHSRYSEVGVDYFSADVDKGELLTKGFASKVGKEIKYFRFPYNDLGIDSIQHAEIKIVLDKKNYMITPFTVESSDWMFNFLYKHYLENDKPNEAKRIADTYISKTIDYINYFDSITVNQYGRKIKQIYLCHDNRIKADCIDEIYNKLKEMNYEFISLDEAMEDDIYKQKDIYYKKWGISWVYRWMTNKKDRMKLLRNEPDLMDIHNEYEKISSQNAKY